MQETAGRAEGATSYERERAASGLVGWGRSGNLLGKGPETSRRRLCLKRLQRAGARAAGGLLTAGSAPRNKCADGGTGRFVGGADWRRRRGKAPPPKGGARADRTPGPGIRGEAVSGFIAALAEASHAQTRGTHSVASEPTARLAPAHSERWRNAGDTTPRPTPHRSARAHAHAHAQASCPVGPSGERQQTRAVSAGRTHLAGSPPRARCLVDAWPVLPFIISRGPACHPHKA